MTLETHNAATMERGLLLTASLPFEIRAINLNASGAAYSCIFDHYPDAAELDAIMQDALSREYGNLRGYTFFCNVQAAKPELTTKYKYLTGGRFVKASAGNTKDGDIERYRWFIIDLDSERPSGTSATAAELSAAESLAKAVKAALSADGFAEPIIAMSGNGYHLMYRIDLEVTATNRELIRAALVALSARFDNDVVHVDKTVYNPARVLKVYGTVARKGKDTEDRPHRLSRIISAPEKLLRNDRVLLERLTEKYSPARASTPEPARTTTAGGENKWSLKEYLDGRGIPYTETRPPAGTIFKAFVNCPNMSAHTSMTQEKDCYLWESANGAKGFKCSHSHCEHLRFSDWRLFVELDAYNPTKGDFGKMDEADRGKEPAAPAYTVANRKPDAPIFVTDSAADYSALSLYGCYAVYAPTKKARRHLAEKLRAADDEERAALLLAFTFNDRDTIKAIEQTRDCAFYVADLSDGYDSIDERALEDIDQLQAELSAPLSEWRRRYIQSRANAAYLDVFMQDIQTEKKYISTGFRELDRALGGGLIPSVYAFGAMPALGKTALLLQIADNIAASGQPVLYFSLEMGKAELISRSISRGTYEKQPRDRVDLACTNQEILMGEFNHYEDRRLLVREVVQDYQKRIAPNLYIFEGVGNITIEEIRHSIEKHISIVGCPPVVVIDYLQIVKNENDRLSDKQVIDRAVTELKRMSRDLDLSILVITSYNRQSYNKAADMSSSKESGAIEYTADNLLDLHHKRVRPHYKEVEGKSGQTTIEKETPAEVAARQAELDAENDRRIKDGEPIAVALSLLKSRNGARGSVTLAYTKRYHHYTDDCFGLAELEGDCYAADKASKNDRGLIQNGLPPKR